jgi:hypothetical protein
VVLKRKLNVGLDFHAKESGVSIFGIKTLFDIHRHSERDYWLLKIDTVLTFFPGLRALLRALNAKTAFTFYWYRYRFYNLNYKP